MERPSQVVFLTGDEYQTLLSKCNTPNLATSDCYVGLPEPYDYVYGTYPYHPAGQTAYNGTWLFLNKDTQGALEISYAMAYFGLDVAVPEQPEGSVQEEGVGKEATRLKEVVQTLVKEVKLPAKVRWGGGKGFE